MKSPHSETLVRKTSSQRSKVQAQATPNSRWSTVGRKSEQGRKRGRRKEEEQDARLSGCRTYVFVSVLATPRMEAWHSGKSHECSHHSSIASDFCLSTSRSLLSHPIQHKWLRVRQRQTLIRNGDAALTVGSPWKRHLTPIFVHWRLMFGLNRTLP